MQRRSNRMTTIEVRNRPSLGDIAGVVGKLLFELLAAAAIIASLTIGAVLILFLLVGCLNESPIEFAEESSSDDGAIAVGFEAHCRFGDTDGVPCHVSGTEESGAGSASGGSAASDEGTSDATSEGSTGGSSSSSTMGTEGPQPGEVYGACDDACELHLTFDRGCVCTQACGPGYPDCPEGGECDADFSACVQRCDACSEGSVCGSYNICLWPE